ncbi:MAG: PilZ domain-containing protein [Candidatus Methylomirabilales bacterium]
MKKERPERRKYARCVVEEGASARIAAVFEASVLNLSVGGALLEHDQLIQPGTLSSLILTLNGRATTLKCRTVRSAVHRLEVQPDGERALIYRTALEFVESSDNAHQMIRDYIQSIIPPDASSSN